MQTMKTFRAGIAVALLSGAVCSQASVFDYSYNFGPGNVVSGTLEGNLSGDIVDNVANVTVFFNGTAMSGSVFTGRYSPPYEPGPIVSFDINKNNFVFANSDPNGGVPTEFLQVIGASALANAQFPGSDGVITDRLFNGWTLTEEPGTGVPDAGSTLAMFGVAFAGLALLRRRV